jgi:hypothetical protein
VRAESAGCAWLVRLPPELAAVLRENLLVHVAEADSGLVEGLLQRAGGTPFFPTSYALAVQQGSTEGVPGAEDAAGRHATAVVHTSNDVKQMAVPSG